MNTFSKTPGISLVILLLVSGCSLAAPGHREESIVPETPAYQTVLGKPLNDSDVIGFLSSNGCSSAGALQVCKEAGMALWIDADQIVEMAYLYAGNAEGFRRYRGELPFGLTFYDPMWLVEEKLMDAEADDTVQPAPQADLREEGSSPDHFHYWAVYNRFNLIVIYNTPFVDEDAYIYAVVVKI